MGRKSTIQIGSKNGRLTVVDIIPQGKGKSAKALCLCECGNKTEVLRINIEKIKSCGCSQHDKDFIKKREKDSYHKLSEGAAMMNNLFSSYRAGAKRRGIDFLIDIDYFKHIATKDCFYCGEKPRERVLYKKDGKPMYNGSAFITGIDRLDSQKPYTAGNCVPCCSDCNFMKNKMNHIDFLNKISMIYNHRVAPITAEAFFGDEH